VVAVVTGGSAGYLLEVATSPGALVARQSDRTETYWSSADAGLLTEPETALPQPVWQRMRRADALVYRVWTTTSVRGWFGARVSTADSDVPAWAPRTRLID